MFVVDIYIGKIWCFIEIDEDLKVCYFYKEWLDKYICWLMLIEKFDVLLIGKCVFDDDVMVVYYKLYVYSYEEI